MAIVNDSLLMNEKVYWTAFAVSFFLFVLCGCVFRIQKQLNRVNGEEIFKLTRSALETYCGKEEGHRLFSQLTLQRKLCHVSRIDAGTQLTWSWCEPLIVRSKRPPLQNCERLCGRPESKLKLTSLKEPKRKIHRNRSHKWLQDRQKIRQVIFFTVIMLQ